ncbi:MAG: CPBP family intramembrane glutamic endopeptidase [Elusimicrobiota bacterium]
MRTSFAAGLALALVFVSSVRAQVRVEAAAPRISPAGVAAVPRGFAPPALVSSGFTAMAAPSLFSPVNAAPAPASSADAAAPSAALPALFPAANIVAETSKESAVDAAPAAAIPAASAPLHGRADDKTRPSEGASVETASRADPDALFDGRASHESSGEQVFAPEKNLLASALARPRTSKRGIAGVAGVVAALGLAPTVLALHGYGTGPLVDFARSAPARLADLKHFAAPFGLPFSPWILAAAAVLVTLVDLGLNILSHYLSPAAMSGRGVPRSRSWPAVIANQALTATFEESFHRGSVFLSAFLLATLWLGPTIAFALAALGEALFFSLSHRYGGIWSRVFGAMLYSGAFLLSGTIWLPIAAHFLHNIVCHVAAGRAPSARRAETAETPEERVERLILNPRAPGAVVAAETMSRRGHYVEGTLDPVTGAVLSARPREHGYDWKPSPRVTSFLLDVEPDPEDSFGMMPTQIEPSPASSKRADRLLRVHFGLRPPSFFAVLFP